METCAKLTRVFVATSMIFLEKSEVAHCFECNIQITAYNSAPATAHIEPHLDPALPAIDISVPSITGAPVGLPDGTYALQDICGKYEADLRHDLPVPAHPQYHPPRKAFEGPWIRPRAYRSSRSRKEVPAASGAGELPLGVKLDRAWWT